jgi:hypothetical protein
MESPEGKPETFDDTVDRLTMTVISKVGSTPGFSNGLWIHHHGSDGQDVFSIENVSLKAVFSDSVPINGVLETRRWISDRLKLFLARRQPEPVNFSGRALCGLCFHPVSVELKVSQEMWKQVTWGLVVPNSTICIACFTRIADERMIQWDRSVEFRPMSKLTAMKLDRDRQEIASANERQAPIGDSSV